MTASEVVLARQFRAKATPEAVAFAYARWVRKGGPVMFKQWYLPRWLQWLPRRAAVPVEATSASV